MGKIVKRLIQLICILIILFGLLMIFEYVKDGKSKTLTSIATKLQESKYLSDANKEKLSKYTDLVVEHDPFEGVDVKVIENEEELIEKLSAKRYYAYSKLNEEEQALYRQMYDLFETHRVDSEAIINNPDIVDKVYNCVLIDNPEFFFTDGYSIVTYTTDDQITGFGFVGIYTMDDVAIANHQQTVDNIVNELVANAPTGDDYSKIKYAYDYIAKTTEYSLEAEQSQNFLSVFERGQSVCQGYATAFQYICIKMDIFCTLVKGETDNGEPHAWNLVQADGDYYYVDVTWGDAAYQFTTDTSEIPEGPEINYDFLCVTTEDIERTHIIDMPYEVEYCKANEDNYYNKEGLYFTEVNSAQLQQLFDTDESYLILKCANEEVYNALRTYLIDDSYIFEYRNTDNIQYVCRDSLNEIIIKR